MSDTTFTGERLHAGSELFSVDLARHRAAYELALEHARGGRVLDFGCGSGHGAAVLAAGGVPVVGVDRVVPDRASRAAGARFLRGDLLHAPLRGQCFDLVVSFQVIEHLVEPAEYIGAIARLVRPGGEAWITTPNLLMSDGVNPFHVHEYVADELRDTLSRHFEEVEVKGIGASQAVHAYMAARSARIRRIMRLDPLGLRDRLPRPLVEWLFARFAVLVRRRTSEDDGSPEATWHDFPVGPADDRCLDLLAVCRRPR